ncbi:MAG: BrnT family toxin [Pseudomonadota bacterium]
MEPFEFDEMKDAENQRKHGLPLEFAPLIFEGPFIEEEDLRRDYGETRIVATGPIEPLGGRICVVVYTWREGIRRIISFRKANEREIGKYQANVD